MLLPPLGVTLPLRCMSSMDLAVCADSSFHSAAVLQIVFDEIREPVVRSLRHIFFSATGVAVSLGLSFAAATTEKSSTAAPTMNEAFMSTPFHPMVRAIFFMGGAYGVSLKPPISAG